jgi:plastocyanin
MRLTRTLSVGMGAAVLLSLAACGDDDTTTPNATPSASSSAPAAATNTLTVDGVDYGFVADKPSVKAGVTTITFVNKGKEAHMMAVAGIKAGKTFADVTKVLQTQDEADDEAVIDFPAGIPGTSSVLAPGKSFTATTTTKAGSYVMLCFVPVQAEGPTKGAPHLAAGMVAPLTVSSEASTDVAPAADGEITVADGKVTLPSAFDGKGTFKVTNSGPGIHSFYVAHRTDGSDFNTLNAKVDKFFQGQVKGEEVNQYFGGGIGILPPGGSAYVVLDFAPGQYTAFCTESGEGDKPHASAGEQVDFTVA